MIACNKHKQTKPKVLKEKSTYFELLSSQDTGIDFRNEAIETTEEMN